MSEPFIPEITGPRKVEKVVETVVSGFINCPPVGTRIKATLGETVIVGKVHPQNFHNGGPNFPMIYVQPDGDEIATVSCWFHSEWVFEILDEAAS